MSSQSVGPADSATEASLTVTPPPTQAVYVSTDMRGAHDVDEAHKDESLTQVYRRVRSRTRARLTQLPRLLGTQLLIILATLAVILLVVTWELTNLPVQRAFGDAHRAHVEVIKARCEYTAALLVYVVSSLSSIWVLKPAILNPSNMSERPLCNAVGSGFANTALVNGIAFISQSLSQGRICYKTYNPDTDVSLLADTHTTNGFYGAGYLVDPTTHLYKEPLEEVFAKSDMVISVPEYFAANPGIVQLITDMQAYRSGKGGAVPPFFMWEAQSAKPTYIFYTYPVPAYDTQGAISADRPDGRSLVQGRLDYQRFFRTTIFSDASRAVLLDSRGLRAGDTNPYLIAASWVARVTDDNTVWSYPDTNVFHYTRVSDITDNIMLAGLTHVKMSDFKENAFDKTKSFHYCGVQSIVTWGNYTTGDGLSLSYVMVDTAGPVRGLMETKFLGITCCAVFIAITLPLVFAAAIDALFGQPLRTVARSLTRAGELGNKKARRHIRDDARIVITEVHELVDAHNEAVDILRAVEAYLPPALLGDDTTTDSADSFNGSLSGTSAAASSSRHHASVRASLFDGRASALRVLPVHNDATARVQMRVSLVTLHPVTRPAVPAPPTAAGTVPLPADDDNTNRPAACGLEALRVLDRETYNAPTPAFHSRWAVQDYAAVVLQAAEQRHGTVLRLAPELTVVCFGGTMEALTRGSADAAALAPTLEAKACATDALAAVLFAQDVRSRLQQLAARDSTRVPDVVAVVETSAYHVGVCRVAKLQQSLSVAVGASLAQICAPPRKMAGGCALATTTTAQLLMHRLRFVPRCVLHVCTRHADHVMYTTEIVHQLLDGHADTQSWRVQCGLLLKALECLHASEYARALTYLQRVPAAARGDMSLMSGARLGAVMRAAADTGVASAQLYGTVQSTLLAHLVRYCEVHLRDPQAANDVLTPASYLDVLARCLPPLPTVDAAQCDFANRSLAYSSSAYGSSAASTQPGRTACDQSAVRRPSLAAVTGVSGQGWYVARDLQAEFGVCPLQQNMLVMNKTGGIAQADELPLVPNALLKFSVAQIRSFVAPHDFPYIVEPEDFIVDAANLRVTAVYEFMSYPTVATYGVIFSHTHQMSLSCRRIFCLISALACLDSEGYAHPRMIPNHLVLFPGGMMKLKAFLGTPKDLLDFLDVPTVHYMSPEEAAGEYPTILSNVYSNAVMAIEFLTRRLPYRWTAAAAADRVEAELTALQEHCGLEFAAALAGGLIEVVDIPAELDMPESMRHILHLCVQRDPALRPRPRDVLRLYRADPYLGPLVCDFPSGPWETSVVPCAAQESPHP